MRAILADKNNEGHVTAIVRRLERDPWDELWADMRLSVLTFSHLGLGEETPDVLVWRACQQQQALLITINRNAHGPDSLEETIRRHNTPLSLPVFTLANADRVLQDRDYLDRVAESLMEYLVDIDNYRGTGRLYLP